MYYSFATFSVMPIDKIFHILETLIDLPLIKLGILSLIFIVLINDIIPIT